MKKNFMVYILNYFQNPLKNRKKKHKLYWEACEVPKNKIIAKPCILM